MDMDVRTVLLHRVQAQNKPINDICNIKLGKKYLFKTVQSPSTQSEHINRYSFGFSGFGLWLLSLGVSIFCWLGLLCFGCLFSNSFFLSFRCYRFRFQSQPRGSSSLLRWDSLLEDKEKIITFGVWIRALYMSTHNNLKTTQYQDFSIYWSHNVVLAIIITHKRLKRQNDKLVLWSHWTSQKSFPRIFEFKFGLSCHHDTALAPWQLPLFCISARRQTAVRKLIRLLLY